MNRNMPMKYFDSKGTETQVDVYLSFSCGTAERIYAIWMEKAACHIIEYMNQYSFISIHLDIPKNAITYN